MISQSFRNTEGLYHRPWQVGPAIIWEDGSYLYYEDGAPHRPSEEGPALFDAQRNLYAYYEHGKLHRAVSQGPARQSPTLMEFYECGIHLWSLHES